MPPQIWKWPVDRLFGDIELTSEFWDDVPKVAAVTAFLLRPTISLSLELQTLGHLLGHLSSL